MTFFEQSRYYFNYVLPDIILSNLEQINDFLNRYWWVFFIFSILMIILNMKYFRVNLKLKLEFRTINKYLKELSLKSDIKDIENYILKSNKMIKAEYSALYELRGETYILLESDTTNNSFVAIPVRLRQKDLKTFKKSGKFEISYFTGENEKYMILFYSYQEVIKERYEGFFRIILGFYAKASDKNRSKGSQMLLNVTKDTSISLMKLQMDKYQFFKFFVALVLKMTKAKGARLLTKGGDLIFEYKPSLRSELQKVFYIRNTPYKLEFYDNKPLSATTLSQVGSFLDMSGAFIENIDKNSEMVKNYLSLLNFTNEAVELENKYYENHSLIVQMVSVEIAKSLFLSEEEIDAIMLGSYLHDIGMVGDLLAVLDRSDLKESDINLIKEHPLIGSIMVEPISHIYPISDIIKYHHERFDGRGYPFGLKESQIPISSQVVAMGEFYAGITSDRSYRKGRTHEEAVAEIKKSENKMFSPILVNVFLEAEKSIKIKVMKIKAKSLKRDKDDEKDEKTV